MTAIENYSKQFKSLNVNRAGGISPHKPCMLLAVIELVESGKLSENKIEFDDLLISRYAVYFNAVKTERDHLNPWMPFFHLQREGFWQLVPKPGRKSILATMTSAVQRSHIDDNILYAVLDNELFLMLKNPVDRDVLRDELMLHWFSGQYEAIKEIVGITEFELMLESTDAQDVKEASPVRSAAFRRLVTEAYDFRCAATGWRVILPDFSILVEAAHIVPFSETHDDRIQNGIALTPTFHWALDRNIIAPGPDLKWHVSRSIDQRIPDNRPLLDLQDQKLILPTDERLRPDHDTLEWRMANLVDVE